MFNFVENKEVSDLLKKIFIPILLMTGLFGNVISIVIFNKKSMKKYSTFQYLTLLSILDLCVLYTGCGQILLDVYYNIDIRLLNQFICKIHSFLVYFFTHYSSMLLALMSVDRTLAIMSANLTKSNHNFKAPLKLFFLLGLFIALVNFHLIFFIQLYDFDLEEQQQVLNQNDSSNSSAVKQSICYARFESYFFLFLTNVFPWIDLCVYSFIPFIIMIFCSTIIIYRIQKKTKELRSIRKNSKNVKHLNRNKQLVIILFATNTLFIFLVLPLVLLNATGNIRENTVPTTVTYILAYSNHALVYI